MIDRRTFLVSAGATATLAALGIRSSADIAPSLKFGEGSPFSFDGIIGQAKDLASRPYTAPQAPPGDILDKIDYDALSKISFKPEYALFENGPGRYPITFFHLGLYSRAPVRMHVIDNGPSVSVAHEIIYDASYFNMPADSPARLLSKGSGFAGFRVQESRLGDQAKLDWRKNDWVSFQGASYFRAIGELHQYGLSARGIAVNVSLPDQQEEFPNFTDFYFETPKSDADVMTVYAMLDGPSVAGAYRFDLHRTNGVVIEAEPVLFLRKDVEQLGLAPATSMYWFSETKKPTAIDWRPEVHDSDGLAIWTGAGEHLWRPLNDPQHVEVSSFSDTDPRGFGLLQRDRNFDHYLDGVFYDRRPSLWIEPLNPFGKGAVQLVEIPTDDETRDNIVAMWVPTDPAKAGASYRLRYRLHWSADEPFPTPLAHCVATRLGNGGVPGQPRPEGVRKFMVEFLGGPLANLPFGVKPEPVLWASRGTFSYIFTEAVPDGVSGHWRAQFDLTATGNDPVDLRLYLKNGDKVLSETWLYQYLPFPTGTSGQIY
jgi:periplasmic glucans biosynthesis protein